MDGTEGPFTREEFRALYAGDAEWDAAETRMDGSEGPFTREEFFEVYGGYDEWDRAQRPPPQLVHPAKNAAITDAAPADAAPAEVAAGAPAEGEGAEEAGFRAHPLGNGAESYLAPSAEDVMKESEKS